jgi:hypothetical protein
VSFGKVRRPTALQISNYRDRPHTTYFFFFFIIIMSPLRLLSHLNVVGPLDSPAGISRRKPPAF